MRLSFIMTLVAFQSFGQLIGFEEIDPKQVTTWLPKSPEEWQGTYHFGDSEGESDLTLLFSKGKVIAQLQTGAWASGGKEWLWNYENLKNVKVEGNKFSSDKASGEFVVYDNGQEKVKGLKILKPWSSGLAPGQWEVGTRSGDAADFVGGEYPQASLRFLEKTELAAFTKPDLRKMRNEIFARYGYKFQPGGEMDVYFKRQQWYRGQHDNVDRFLTDIEKANIILIKSLEDK